MYQSVESSNNFSSSISFTQPYTTNLTVLYDSPAHRNKPTSKTKKVVKQRKNNRSDVVQIKISCPSNCSTTQQALIKAHSKAKTVKKPVFIRDTELVGYALKVNPQGSIQNIVEISHNGISYRKTIARLNIIGYQHNVDSGMTVEEARNKALAIIAEIRGSEDIYSFMNTGLTLEELLKQYMGLNLTENTKRDYKHTITFYLSDWMKLNIQDITKQMIVDRFIVIRDHGFNGGKATHSQASKTFRVLSAMFNYAQGFELLEQNNCEVLKQRRLHKFNKSKTSYLTQKQGRKLLDTIGESKKTHYLAVQMFLHTGLRREECLGLKWSEIQEIDGVKCIVLDPKRTKNKRIHILPVTPTIQCILDKCGGIQKGDRHVFMRGNGNRLGDIRKTLSNLTNQAQLPTVTLHDLRRSFASCAQAVGIEHRTIKALMNHVSDDITDRYIQRTNETALLALRDQLDRVVY